MSNFLIDTPYHKRWMLPDGIHCINSVIYGDEHLMSVLVSRTLERRESFTAKLSNPQSEDLWYAFQEMAKKKYARRLRTKENMRRDEAFAQGEVNFQRFRNELGRTHK